MFLYQKNHIRGFFLSRNYRLWDTYFLVVSEEKTPDRTTIWHFFFVPKSDVYGN